MTLPDDIIQFMRWVANSGYSPLDSEADRLLAKYTGMGRVGPSEYKASPTETWALPPGTEEQWKLNS